MSLIKEIEEKRKEIFTDSYPMSIGELANLYRDGEIKINPAFQRFYRWTDTQKVRLIESILLGIPLPSIFVAQRDDGVWVNRPDFLRQFVASLNTAFQIQ